MKALIVYDTKFGMTEQVANAIMKGMKEGGIFEVATKKAENVDPADFKGADAWIFGSPVHFAGATGDSKKALKAAIETGTSGKKGTAFDTRYAGFSSRGAAMKMMEDIEEAGIKKITEPQWFVVGKSKGPLADGEEAKAIAFGKKIAEALRS
jgi:flavodoxin